MWLKIHIWLAKFIAKSRNLNLISFLISPSFFISFSLQGNSVEMFFIKPGRSSAPFKLGDFLKASTILASNNLLSNVQTQIPQLQIETLQPAVSSFPFLFQDFVFYFVVSLVEGLGGGCQQQQQQQPRIQKILRP